MMIIRCSTLPHYNDCPRRAVANGYKRMIEDAGFKLRDRLNGIAAAVGTASHHGSGHVMILKRDGFAWNLKDAQEISIEKFKTESAGEVIYDTTTPSKNVGEKQILRLVQAFCAMAAPTIQPEFIEKKKKATINDQFQLSGTPDIETVINELDDLKFGMKMKIFDSQIGGYILLRQANKLSTETAKVRHFPRTAINKPFPGQQIHNLDIKLCLRAAWGTIKLIMRDLTEFTNTGSEWSFSANPMSMLCSNKYCNAWGTNFCQFGRKI